MPPSGDAVAKVSEYPIVLWFIAVALLIGIAISTIEKVSDAFGKVGKTAREWLLSRRRAADEEEDKRLVDMQSQIDYLETRVLSLIQRSKERDVSDEAMYAVLIEHQAWDRQVLQRTDAGELVGPPPSLWPTSIPVPQPPVPPGASSSPEAV